jgi:predicted transcriptional regulator
MATSTVEISEDSRELLRVLAAKTGQTAVEVLDQALAAYRRQVFMADMNRGYAELRADPHAWAEHETERQQLDAANADGLDGAECWTHDGACLPKE